MLDLNGDMAVFFNSDEFAVEGVATPRFGSPIPVLGHYDEFAMTVVPSGVNTGMRSPIGVGAVDISSTAPRFTTPSIGAADIAIGDEFTVNGQTYVVADTRVDGDLTVLHLHA